MKHFPVQLVPIVPCPLHMDHVKRETVFSLQPFFKYSKIEKLAPERLLRSVKIQLLWSFQISDTAKLRKAKTVVKDDRKATWDIMGEKCDILGSRE